MLIRKYKNGQNASHLKLILILHFLRIDSLVKTGPIPSTLDIMASVPKRSAPQSSDLAVPQTHVE